MKAEQRDLDFERQRYACRTCLVNLGRARAVVMARRPQQAIFKGQRGEHEGFVCPNGDHRPWDPPVRDAA